MNFYNNFLQRNKYYKSFECQDLTIQTFQKKMATYLYCTSCKCQMYYISNAAYSYNPASLLLCNMCHANGKAKEYVKKAYSLDSKEENSQLRAIIKKYKEGSFFDDIESGQMLGNYLSQRSAKYMQKHHCFLQNIISQQSELKDYVKKSTDRMTTKLEKKVLGIIANEAKALAEDINVVDGNNDKKIQKAIQYREKIKEEMSKVNIITEIGQNPEYDINECDFVFGTEELAKVLAVCEGTINKTKTKSTVLSRLIMEGENINAELVRDKGDGFNNSKIMSSTFSKMTSSKVESVILVEEREKQ